MLSGVASQSTAGTLIPPKSISSVMHPNLPYFACYNP
jgi:hypothetical protein